MKYLIECKEEDFTLEVPDDSKVEITRGYKDNEQNTTVTICAGKPVDFDGYYDGSVIAFYQNVEAVRCVEQVTRTNPDIA